MTIKVLVVDDDPSVRATLRLWLSSADGMSVVGEAGDGESAVTAAEQAEPDVILMDVHLPRMSGVEAARRLRAKGMRVPVVFLSADDSAAAAARRIRGSEFLGKSVTGRAEAVRALRRAARRRTVRRDEGR